MGAATCRGPDAARWWGDTATFNGTIGLRLQRTNCAIARNGLRPAADIVSANSLSTRNLRELPNQGDIERARDALRLTGVIRLQEAPGASQLIATYDLGILTSSLKRTSHSPAWSKWRGYLNEMVAGARFGVLRQRVPLILVPDALAGAIAVGTLTERL